MTEHIQAKTLRSKETVGIIAEAFRKYVGLQEDHVRLVKAFERGLEPFDFLREAGARIRASVDYSAPDISEFASALPPELDEVDCGNWGAMLTCLIQEGPAGEYIIQTSNELIELGYKLDRRDVTVRVYGDVSDGLGYEMRNGRIVVEGNATIEVGAKMEGGELHILGEFQGLGEPKGGRIFQWGELIFDGTK